MLRVITAVVLLAPSTAFADARFIGDFESGRILKKESTTDGFWLHTLPINQNGSESVGSGAGGFGPTDPYDTRVIASRIPPKTGLGAASEGTVLPRAGRFYLEASLHRDKNYAELNGGKSKPRAKINPYPDERLDFDTEGYTGFSIYLPTNFEIEAGAARRTLLFAQNTDASSTLLTIQLGAPEVGRTKWAAIWYTDATSVRESAGARRTQDLGLIENDRGKWTDFVIRYRWNPFSVRTNASKIAGGKNQEYKANQGILQIWKATGPVDRNGNRTMKLMVDLENEPVGLVPKADRQIHQTFKIYKPTWQLESTTVRGPVWIGFDEIRTGRATADLTVYSDVHPSGLNCTDRCPAEIPPRPPRNLVLLQ